VNQDQALNWLLQLRPGSSAGVRSTKVGPFTYRARSTSGRCIDEIAPKQILPVHALSAGGSESGLRR
jgi:hypothetical protein